MKKKENIVMSTENISRPRRTFTPEFKQQIVDLYRSGKRKCDIIREYGEWKNQIANALPEELRSSLPSIEEIERELE